MNTFRTKERARRRAAAASLLAVAALVAASCGDDDDEDAEPAATSAVTSPPAGTTEPETTPVQAPTDTTATETSSTATTASDATSATTETTERAPGAVPRGDPVLDCAYRSDELVATSDLAAVVSAEVGGGVVEEFPLTPDGVEDGDPELDLGLSLYRFTPVEDDDDPLAVAAALNGTPQQNGIMSAAPNYLASFSPNWRYAPYDDPVEAEPPQDLEALALGGTEAPIAVVDTGYAEVEGAPASQVTVVPVVRPDVPGGALTSPPPPELFDGRVAGHGTFIVNMLAQLLPGSTIHAVTLPARLAGDDDYDNAVQPGVSVRDDSTVTWAIETLLVDDVVRSINLSGGSYGCTSRPGDVEDYYEPLGLRRLMELLEERNSRRTEQGQEQDQIHVFVASGNDAQREGDAVFFPAGRAPEYEWLHSVASNPADDGTDYSNRARWVEFQAVGSHVVSFLPETNRPPADASAPLRSQPAGWYSWSGTSFATPCALAAHAVGAPALEPATPNGTGPYTDCRINR